jgi:CheY-like chemotaxis protein
MPRPKKPDTSQDPEAGSLSALSSPILRPPHSAPGGGSDTWCISGESVSTDNSALLVTHGADRPKILIVDEEPGLAPVISLMLTLLDRYEVLTVVDPTQALEAVVKFKPDLVVLDWVIPMLSGGDVAQQVRSDSRVCDTPILILSALVSKGEEPIMIAGCPAIGKPVGLKELVEAIEKQRRKVARRGADGDCN